MRPAPRRRAPLLLALAAAVLLIAACSSGGGDSASDSGGDADFSKGDAPAEAPTGRNELERSATDDGLAFDHPDADMAALSERAPQNAVGRKIIAKGNVSLEAESVGNAAFHVSRLADEHGGEVTERETTTNDDGDISTARLLLRIPVGEFDQAFTGLEDVVGTDLQSSNTGKEDVTTKVIDTQVRIRAQRRSLARVEALFDRAQSISDIIRIESQVSQRQADLESLQQRLNYLNDQTSMSTISVNISLPPKEKKEKKKDEPEEAGFFAGLEDGWDALKSFGTGTATVAGALLPWTAVLLLIGGPVLLLMRRLRRRDDEDVPDVPVAG